MITEEESQRSLERYKQSKPLALPIIHSKNIRIDSFDVLCKSCDNSTEEVRGEVVNYAKCVDVWAGGFCEKCKLVTCARMRFYEDHILHWSDDGIVEIPIEKSAWQEFKLWFKGLFKKKN